jgi:hypothetical protein
MNGFNFTDRVRTVLQMARDEAARLRHEYVGTEHILLGLIREGEGVAAAVLTNLNVDLQDVVRRIEETVKRGKMEAPDPDLPYTSRAKKVLEFAMSEARELNHSYIGTEHLLLGLLREEKGLAAQALTHVGLNLEQTRAETLRLLGAEPMMAAPFLPDQLDQAFKTALALIELHHRRFGTYPESLGDIQFAGLGYSRYFDAVRYEKLSEGYGLDVVTEGEKPGLSYPPDFWRGLGIRRTNVEGLTPP